MRKSSHRLTKLSTNFLWLSSDQDSSSGFLHVFADIISDSLMNSQQCDWSFTLPDAPLQLRSTSSCFLCAAAKLFQLRGVLTLAEQPYRCVYRLLTPAAADAASRRTLINYPACSSFAELSTCRSRSRQSRCTTAEAAVTRECGMLMIARGDGLHCALSLSNEELVEEMLSSVFDERVS